MNYKDYISAWLTYGKHNKKSDCDCVDCRMQRELEMANPVFFTAADLARAREEGRFAERKRIFDAVCESRTIGVGTFAKVAKIIDEGAGMLKQIKVTNVCPTIATYTEEDIARAEEKGRREGVQGIKTGIMGTCETHIVRGGRTAILTDDIFRILDALLAEGKKEARDE